MNTAKPKANIRSWHAANTYLGKKNNLPIAYNTRIIRHGEAIGIVLYATEILTYLPYDAIVLRSGGWNTRTTAARINNFLPRGILLFSKKGQWIIVNWHEQQWPFSEGIIILDLKVYSPEELPYLNIHD